MIEAIRTGLKKKLDLSNLSNSHCSYLRKIEMKEAKKGFMNIF
jgi:hypothetical protein